MGAAHAKEDCSPSDSHKVARFSEKIEIIKTPRPCGPIQQPSYVFEEEVPPDEHPVQRNESIDKSLFALTDQEPWASKTILSLGGGGVRGYSSLLILQQLMEMIANLERSANPEAISSAYSPLVDCLHDIHLRPIASDTKSTSHYLP